MRQNEGIGFEGLAKDEASSGGRNGSAGSYELRGPAVLARRNQCQQAMRMAQAKKATSRKGEGNCRGGKRHTGDTSGGCVEASRFHAAIDGPFSAFGEREIFRVSGLFWLNGIVLFLVTYTRHSLHLWLLGGLTTRDGK